MANDLAKHNVPKVSVVLPVYGYSKFLHGAINSILCQTLKEIELVIIEDPKNGRFENEAIIEKYKSDLRIRYFKNEHREGLVNSLNKAISVAQSDYIARQDADDVSLPERLSVQHESLKRTGGIVVGGNMIIINDNGETKGYRKYPEVIEGKAMLLGNMIGHPTVMFDRKAILSLGGYDSKMVHVEDYDLWSRLMDEGHNIYNLSNYLIKYRYHKEAIKYRVFKKLVLNTIKLQILILREYRNLGYHVLFPIYLFLEILLLVLPTRIGYFLFQRFSVTSKY